MRNRELKTLPSEDDGMIYDGEVRAYSENGVYSADAETLERWLRNGCGPEPGITVTDGRNRMLLYPAWRDGSFCRIEIRRLGISGLPEPGSRASEHDDYILWSSSGGKHRVSPDGGKTVCSVGSDVTGRIFGSYGAMKLISASPYLCERLCLPETSVRRCALKMLTPDIGAAAEAFGEYREKTASAEDCYGKIYTGLPGLCALRASDTRDGGKAIGSLPDDAEIAGFAEQYFADGITPEEEKESLAGTVGKIAEEITDSFMSGLPDVWFSAGFVNPYKAAETLLRSEYAGGADVYALARAGRTAVLATAVPERMELLRKIAEGKEKPEAAGITPEKAGTLAAAHAVSRAAAELNCTGAKTMTAVLEEEGKQTVRFRTAPSLRYSVRNGSFAAYVLDTPKEETKRLTGAGYSIGDIRPESVKSIMYAGRTVYSADSLRNAQN